MSLLTFAKVNARVLRPRLDSKIQEGIQKAREGEFEVRALDTAVTPELALKVEAVRKDHLKPQCPGCRALCLPREPLSDGSS